MNRDEARELKKELVGAYQEFQDGEINRLDEGKFELQLDGWISLAALREVNRQLPEGTRLYASKVVIG